MSKKPSAETTLTIDSQRLRAGQRSLSSEEERALRMRHGLGVPADEPLERKGQAHPEVRARLAELELQAFKAAGHIYGLSAAPTPAAKAQPSRAKDKIIRALRRK